MKTDKERFESKFKIDEETGCWLWVACQYEGYGKFALREGVTLKTRSAHRAAYSMYVAPIPKGGVICHRCDTTLCVNPKHLFLGTQDDNVQDMVKKGRGWWQKGRTDLKNRKRWLKCEYSLPTCDELWNEIFNKK